MKNIAIMCGGKSYEHAVSIISGIQIAEHIDRTKYQPYFVYLNNADEAFLVENFSSHKQDFRTNKHTPIDLVKRNGGLALQRQSLFSKPIKIDAVYNAFHGGSGEAGPMQGLLAILDVPHTAAGQEGAVLAMNKAVTKEVLVAHNVPVLPWISVTKEEFETDRSGIKLRIIETLGMRLIIKPVHLGSSIGIAFANSEIELEQQLLLALQIDSEVLIEPALTEFTEYNIGVRSSENGLQFTPIEEPIRKDAILSFDDKYANGSKKGGGKQAGGGMELLDRTIPAKISEELATEIRAQATAVYRACRLSGMLRIDFMYSDGKLYCTEPNPVPGSLAFYLWEVNGETFQEQITHDLEDAIARHKQRITAQPYETDIVEKFIGS